MNRLHRLDEPRDYLVTLNPGVLDERVVLARMVYDHPVYTVASMEAQAGLPDLNDRRPAVAGA